MILNDDGLPNVVEYIDTLNFKDDTDETWKIYHPLLAPAAVAPAEPAPSGHAQIDDEKSVDPDPDAAQPPPSSSPRGPSQNEADASPPGNSSAPSPGAPTDTTRRRRLDELTGGSTISRILREEARAAGRPIPHPSELYA